MSNDVHVIDHPLVAHKLTLMRDSTTPPPVFRQLLNEIALLLCYEVTRDLPLTKKTVQTPLATIDAPILDGKKLALVAILRAGNGLLEGMLNLVPAARVGHIGLYRDPNSLTAIEYYLKLPEDIESRPVIIVDPMLATGNSASAAISRIKQAGAKDIRFACVLAAPEGIANVRGSHPDVHIFAASIESHLDENGYIIPGLGDAGDRMYGTR